MLAARQLLAKLNGDRSSAPDQAEQPSVLVIQDSDPDRAAIVSDLAAHGYRVLEAASREEALAGAAASRPDLVVLGGSLVEMECEDFCLALRAESAGAQLPILIIIQSDDASAIKRAMRAGATDLLAGPVNAGLLRYRVEHMLQAFATECDLHRVKNLSEGATETIALLSQSLQQQVTRHTEELAATRDKLIEKERQLRQSQKMDALGQLAGGVAHEFNNQLTVMSGFARAAIDYSDDPDRVRDCLAEVISAADRAAVLTAQMLLFSRDQVILPVVMHIGQALENMRAVLRWAGGGSVDLVLDTPDSDAIAKADPVQLSQAMLNLAVNARDAMPKGGRLTITCDTVELDGSARISHYAGEVAPGSYVRIQVQDTGMGMDPATLDRIFDPFFTTKEAGKGTGLGLSVVFAIVEQCGGMINVASTLGEGTTFTVYFPSSNEPVSLSSGSDAPEIAEGIGGTILLVEDEPAVLSMVSMLLRGAGYDVIPVKDGLEAVEVMREAGQDIDLFVTDVVMPGLSGTDLATIFQRDFPDKPVLFMSGYAPALEEYRAREGDRSHFIGKPFKPHELVEKVNQILAGANSLSRTKS